MAIWEAFGMLTGSIRATSKEGSLTDYTDFTDKKRRTHAEDADRKKRTHAEDADFADLFLETRI